MYNISSSPMLINVTLADNIGVSGSAIYNQSNSNLVAINTIIWGDVTENLIVNNGVTNVNTISYSIVPATETTYTDAGNNKSDDPMFVGGGNYSLQADSPAIDMGNDSANTTSLDLADNPRKDGVIDMGAFEYVFLLPVPTLGQWGVMILALLLLILGVVSAKNRVGAAI